MVQLGYDSPLQGSDTSDQDEGLRPSLLLAAFQASRIVPLIT